MTIATKYCCTVFGSPGHSHTQRRIFVGGSSVNYVALIQTHICETHVDFNDTGLGRLKAQHKVQTLQVWIQAA